MRIILGFLVAPIVPAMIVSLYSLGFGMTIALFGFMTALVLGMPTHLILKKKMWVGWKAYTLSGLLDAALGWVLSTGIILALSGLKLSATNVVGVFLAAFAFALGGPFFLTVCLSGAVGGLTFWLIVRPDKLRSVPPASS